MRRQVLVCALLLVCALPSASMAQTADSGFSITSDKSIQTPERTITVDGDDYQVSSIARIRPDGSLTLSITAPSETSYDLFLYDNERQIVATNSESGETTWSLDGSDYSAGSYVVAVYVDGEYKAVQPIVVSGYAVEMSPPETVTHEADFETTIEISSLADADDISNVEVILMNEEMSRSVDAAESEAGTYTATLSATVPPGEYRVYATVKGDEGYEGQAELLGISNRHAVTVEEATTEQPGGNGDGGGESDGTDGGSEDDNSDSTPATTTDTTTIAETTTTASTTPEQPTSQTSTAATTTDAIVTPSESTTTATATTSSGSVPLKAPQLLLLCTVIGMLLLRLRSS